MFINNTYSIDVMNEVAFHCTIYQFSQQFVTSKPVSQILRQVWTCILSSY